MHARAGEDRIRPPCERQLHGLFGSSPLVASGRYAYISSSRPADDERSESMAKEIFVAYGIDVDAVAGWLGSYGGEDSPCDISRGLFAGEVGSPRLLKLFDHYDLRTTWFIPGHSIETFPRQMQMVADAGHEIGLHGYSHENPVAMTPEQEETVLNKCIDLIERFSGRRPT